MHRPAVTELLRHAVSLHQRGDLAQAAPLYRQVLEAEPRNADACHYLGILAQQSGHVDVAQAMLRRAVALNPALAPAHYHLGVVLMGLKQFAAAVPCFWQTVQLNSGHVDAHINLGNALQELNEPALAFAAYRGALRLAPQHPYIPHNLGNVLLALGQPDEAARCYRQALQLDPGNAMAHYKLGNILRGQGRFAEAGNCYRQALAYQPKLASAHNNLGILQARQGLLTEAVLSYREALRHNPQLADACINLGDALKSQRQFAQALDCYRQAARIHPEIAAFQSRLASLLSDLGQLPEAIGCFRQAVRLDPQDAGAHYNLATALSYHGLHDDAAASFRAALERSPNNACFHNSLGMALKNQGRLEESIACVEQARRLEPREPMWHSNLLICRLYSPAYGSGQILEDQHRWYQEHAQALAPTAPSFANDRSPDRRLRIGYVSANFGMHIDGRNIMPLLRTHERRRFEITLYSNRANEDARTTQICKLADRWRAIADWSDERVAAKVKDDRIDILVDLSAHTAGNRLLVFARKPAPVQVTWLGVTGGTTGLATIDYRFTDPYLDPPGPFAAGCAEAPFCLPTGLWCFEPPPTDGVAATADGSIAPLAARANGGVTFGSLNSFFKINGDILAVWAQVLRAVPRSRLLLKTEPGSQRQRTRVELARHGIDAERLEFCEPQKSFDDYLALYRRIDIGLDTLPYNGHSTSLDAFWMGVPIATLVGQTMVGRVGYSQLCYLGLNELAATTPAGFVELVTELAGDLSRLQDLRAGLRDRMRRSPLMDPVGYTRGIEAAYREMWRRWCDGRDEAIGARFRLIRMHTAHAPQSNTPTILPSKCEKDVKQNAK
jgi:protein O-GlcNAc transferase